MIMIICVSLAVTVGAVYAWHFLRAMADHRVRMAAIHAVRTRQESTLKQRRAGQPRRPPPPRTPPGRGAVPALAMLPSQAWAPPPAPPRPAGPVPLPEADTARLAWLPAGAGGLPYWAAQTGPTGEDEGEVPLADSDWFGYY